MNIATLGVAIDPTSATQGSAAAVKALDNVTKAAKETVAATAKVSKETGAAAAGAGNAQATAHQGTLSKMAAAIKNFFATTNAGAQQSQSMLGGMIGHLVQFLQSILSMVPGATGAFAGLAGAAGGAATSLAGIAGGGAAAMLVLGPLVAILVALVAAFVALGVAAVVTWKAIGAAAEMEKLEVQYTVLIGNVKKTQQTLAELREFADVTPFDTKGVMQWGQEMLNAGIAAKDLTSTMHDLGNAALGDPAKMDTAVLVLTQSIGKMKADTMDLRQLGNAGIPIMEGLEKSLGKTSSEVVALVSKGKIGFTELRAAFAALGGEGGRLGAMMDKMSETWEGRMSTIRSRWDNLLIAFGTPIKDALGPYLVKLDALLKSMIPMAERAGNTVAGAFITGDWDGVWTVIKLKGQNALLSMAQSFGASLDTIVSDVWKKMVEMFKADIAMITALISGITGGDKVAPPGALTAGGLLYTHGPIGAGGANPHVNADLDVDPATQQINENNAKIAEILARFEKAGKDQPPAIDWAGLKETPRPAPGTGTADDTSGKDAFKGDAYFMEEFNKALDKMKQLQSEGKMSDVEFGRRQEELKTKTAGELDDPNKYASQLDAWRTFNAEKEKVAAQTEARIKSGQAGTEESFIAGIQKATAAWGNASQQWQKLGEGVANSLSTNISGALTSIVTGTKDAKTAFRDMAVAILNDIAKMIIQMLVELAIQQALKAFGFNGGGSVGGGFANKSSSSLGVTAAPAKLAGGGGVHGGAGGIDDVPAMLTRGEYVIPKDSAEYYGTRWLDMVREKRVGRFATGGPVVAGSRGNMLKPGTASADSYSFNISVDAGGGGGDNGDIVGGGSQATKKKKGEALAKQIELAARQVIRDEMRPGGALYNR